jgi:hypothetical protein
MMQQCALKVDYVIYKNEYMSHCLIKFDASSKPVTLPTTLKYKY